MLVTFTIIPYLHVTIINKCHYWKNIVLHIFCTRFSTCPKFVLRLQVAWWSVLSRSKTARYPTRIPTLLQNTGWLHILLAFEEIWHRSHWNCLLTTLTLIIEVVALTRMLANPKILEETGVRVVWPSIFAQFSKFWPSCCWTISEKKPGNWCINEIYFKMYEIYFKIYFKMYEIYFKIYEIYMKIMLIFSHQVCICPSFADTNIIREGMEVILQWRPSSIVIHNLHHTHNQQRGGMEVILRSRLSWDLWIVNYRLGGLCVISDNLGNRPT